MATRFIAPPAVLTEVPVIATREEISTNRAPYGVSFDAVVLKPVEEVIPVREGKLLRKPTKTARAIALTYSQRTNGLPWRRVFMVNPRRIYLFDLSERGVPLDEVNTAALRPAPYRPSHSDGRDSRRRGRGPHHTGCG